MKQNFMDIVTDELKKRIGAVAEEAREQFKGTNPYRKEPVPKKDLLEMYDSIQTPEQMQQLIQTHGADKMNEFIRQMETLRQGGV